MSPVISSLGASSLVSLAAVTLATSSESLASESSAPLVTPAKTSHTKTHGTVRRRRRLDGKRAAEDG